MNLPLPEQTRAARLLDLYGHTSNDYFKLWIDKEYWFTPSGNSFVAFGVAKNKVAVSLGDPVASNKEIEHTIRGFGEYCKSQGWTPLFYQVSPKYLDIYEKIGYQDFKGSEEAIVDLESFTLSGKDRKAQRNVMNKMAKEGFSTIFHDTPVPDDIIAQARVVSDSWLSNNNRRERMFTVGRFEEDYVRHTPMMTVVNAEGEMLAFANIIPSYAANTATIDMMRFKDGSPHGVMDFLFIKLFEHNKAEGFKAFSLGPAPIMSPEPDEDSSREEKSFYRLTNYLDTFFSMRGLRDFKGKYATTWEPRYLVYKRRVDLPRFVNAINDLCELDENKTRLLSAKRANQVRKVSVTVLREMRKASLKRRETIKRKRVARREERQAQKLEDAKTSKENEDE